MMNSKFAGLLLTAFAVVAVDWTAKPTFADDRLARNVILFIGDAGGIPTINAAAIYKYRAPRKLFIHTMPYVALVETSSASEWVTDSAAAMTAMVTGHKTHNGVLSQSESAVRGVKDGEALKTILEHAEERGLSTGVVSNSSVASATPAACYAHVNDRRKEGEIFVQALTPRFGDGIDLVIGPDRAEILESTRALGVDIVSMLRKSGRDLYDSLEALPAGADRPVVLLQTEDFDLGRATEIAIEILSRNQKGFFLMVESNLHTQELIRGLERTVALDDIIRRTAARTDSKDTLILFTADHSYDFRVYDGAKSEALLGDFTDPAFGDDVESMRLDNVRRDDDHTGEEVLAAAQGPGADRVRGVLSNTDIFHIMTAAYGWDSSSAGSPKQAVNR
jgi:alkaline phosphatase